MVLWILHKPAGFEKKKKVVKMKSSNACSMIFKHFWIMWVVIVTDVEFIYSLFSDNIFPHKTHRFLSTLTNCCIMLLVFKAEDNFSRSAILAWS